MNFVVYNYTSDVIHRAGLYTFFGVLHLFELKIIIFWVRYYTLRLAPSCIHYFFYSFFSDTLLFTSSYTVLINTTFAQA